MFVSASRISSISTSIANSRFKYRLNDKDETNQTLKGKTYVNRKVQKEVATCCESACGLSCVKRSRAVDRLVKVERQISVRSHSELALNIPV